MKQFKIWATSALALGILFFLISCGSGDKKKTDEATTDSTMTKPADSTVAVTPAPKSADLLVIQHKVANYAKWKPGYDAHDSVRVASGLASFRIGRGMDDSNMVIITMKMTDTAKAKAMISSADMKKVMQKAGVIGKPNFWLFHAVMLDESPMEQNARLRVTHKVKDWDAWKKVFDEDKPNRVAAGLIDRSVSYGIDDNHLVSVVFAVNDMQKTKAMMNSKELKDKMAAGGVEGAPTFFFYNIVEKF